ncbi:zinc finger 6-like [Olea europaea subsp. europaea]|uniref:Zinc finger 6-like n=1 Tax=Olea europaea subsp. europaea TaxID=158383 RepID=A0A8S0RS70_OLEEU|nr:zinc finger 6-like [Olea europaea subsp. europaea]
MALKGKGVLVLGDKNEANLSPVEKNEMTKLTKTVRFHEYTCTFCFKKFYCAQAMGGHQNAHRLERNREKKLFVQDTIGYPKQAFIRSVKTLKDSESKRNVAAIKFRLLNNLMKRETAPAVSQKVIKPHPSSFEVGESSSSRVARIVPQKKLAPLRIKPKSVTIAAKGHYYYHPYYNQRFVVSKKPTFSPIQLNSFPPKELSLAEKVGIHAEAMLCNGGNEVEAEKLDLTLKL